MIKKAAVMILVAGVAQASVESKKNLSQIKINIDQAKQTIVEAEVKKRGVLGTLYDINKNLNKINSDIQTLESELKTAKRKIENQTVFVGQLQQVKSQQKNQLALRLRALYKMGFHGYAQVLLASHSSMELSRNVKFLKIVTEKDAKLLASYSKSIIEVETQQAKLKNHLRNYLIFEKTLESDRSKYSEQKNSQLFLLSQIEQDKQTHVEALKEWREAGLKLEEKLKRLGEKDSMFDEVARASFFEKQGQLKPPVFREVMEKYGIVTNSKFDTKIFHKGLFFAAHLGDKVSALYNGRVVHAGWVNGFGETIIIDHGDHYYSLYAHNSELLKKVGEEVGPGDPIARAGDTGSLRGPGLYFEIRHFSESLDPMPWLDLKSFARL